LAQRTGCQFIDVEVAHLVNAPQGHWPLHAGVAQTASGSLPSPSVFKSDARGCALRHLVST
jgi:hypothetical protein